jgi:hypothetical protein
MNHAEISSLPRATREQVIDLLAEARAVSQPINLGRWDLSGLDLSGLDFHLAHFVGQPLARLTALGLSPRQILSQRSAADRHAFPSLHFTAQRTEGPHLLLTARECNQVVCACAAVPWEGLVDAVVFHTLFPEEPWSDWLGRCTSREILDWALQQRPFLEAYYPRRTGIPFYGRVLPLTLIDEVQPTDLVAGRKTDPERLFYEVGLRQLVRHSDLQGEDVNYLPSPFGETPGVAQIKSRRALQIEGGLMKHCVASYDWLCQAGATLIYHVGAPAPLGSTLELSPQGRVMQHRAALNRLPSPTERETVTAWLRSQGIEQPGEDKLAWMCAQLRQAGIAKVTWQIYWEDDENHLEDVWCYNEREEFVALPHGVTEEDVEDLVYEQGGNTGRFELVVAQEDTPPGRG